MGCCTALAETGRQTPPLARVIAIDLYDGPTAGIAECAGCQKPYSFRMEAWDDHRVLRVFTLAPLPDGSFGNALAVFSGAGQPVWPEWWPSEFASDEAREAAWRRANEILASAEAPEYVILTKDLSEIPAAVLQIDDPEKRSVLEGLLETGGSFEDWYTFVNPR
jgi:hypothetical protein